MKRSMDFDKQLEEAIGKAPDYKLPDHFADRVVRKIEMKKIRFDRRINAVVIMASCGFLLLAALSFVLFTTREMLQQMLDLSGWAVLIGVMVVLIQALDHRLVKKNLPDHH